MIDCVILPGPCDPATEPECDCPTEHWHVGGICTDIHIEPEGYTHVIMDSGDWTLEVNLPYDNLGEARGPALEWAKGQLRG